MSHLPADRSKPVGGTIELRRMPGGVKFIACAGRATLGGCLAGLVFVSLLLSLLGMAIVMVIFGPNWLNVLPASVQWVVMAVIGSALVWFLSRFVTRRVEISAGDGELRILEIGLRSSKLRTWRADEIADIRMVERGQSESRLERELRIDFRGNEELPFINLIVRRTAAELEWIAATLREALALPKSSPNAATTIAGIGPLETYAFAPRHERPPDADGVARSVPGGITIETPAQRFVRSSRYYLIGGLGAIAFGAVAGLLVFHLGSELTGSVIFWGVCGVLGVVQIALGIDRAKRRAGIAAIDGALEILTTGLWRTRRRWEAGQIKDISVGFAGEIVNFGQRRLLGLIVTGVEGEPFCCLVDHNTDELEWIATALREALAVPSAAISAAGSPRWNRT